MAKDVSIVKGIQRVLQEYGYEEQSGVPYKGKNDVFYFHNTSSVDAVHVLRLIYKPPLKAYGVYAGVFNQEAKKILKSWIPDLKKFLHPLVIRECIRQDDEMLMSCGQLFEAGRYLGWDRLVIPDPRNREDWPHRLDDLFQRFLKPIFISTKEIGDIRDLLFRTNPTFEWFNTNAVLRVAEIVALDSFGDARDPNLREKLKNFESDVEGALAQSEVKDYDALLDFLFSLPCPLSG